LRLPRLPRGRGTPCRLRGPESLPYSPWGLGDLGTWGLPVRTIQPPTPPVPNSPVRLYLSKDAVTRLLSAATMRTDDAQGRYPSSSSRMAWSPAAPDGTITGVVPTRL